MYPPSKTIFPILYNGKKFGHKSACSLDDGNEVAFSLLRTYLVGPTRMLFTTKTMKKFKTRKKLWYKSCYRIVHFEPYLRQVTFTKWDAVKVE